MPSNEFSEFESKRFSRALKKSALVSLLFFANSIGTVATILLAIFQSELFPQQQYFVIVPLLLFWMFLLRDYPKLFLNLRKDYNKQLPQTLHGIGILHSKPVFRVLFSPPMQFSVDGHSFDLFDYPTAQLFVGSEVKVRYLTHSNFLLSVEQITTTHEKQPFELTELEMGILKLICQGLSDKLIARELDLEPATVRTYNSTLYKKLDVSNRKQASKKAIDSGIINVN